MITTILFDYGKVLGSDSNEWNTYFKEVLDLTGLNAEELDKIWVKYWYDDLRTGKIKLAFFWEEISKIAKKPVSSEKLIKVYLDKFNIFDSVLEVAKKLKDNGYKLVILANESIEAMDTKVKKFHLDKIFDNIYSSGEIGLAKPHKEAFEYVLNNLEVSSEEVVFIDNLKRNTKAAEKLGIKSIVFKDVEQLKKDLKMFGVEV